MLNEEFEIRIDSGCFMEYGNLWSNLRVTDFVIVWMYMIFSNDDSDPNFVRKVWLRTRSENCVLRENWSEQYQDACIESDSTRSWISKELGIFCSPVESVSKTVDLCWTAHNTRFKLAFLEEISDNHTCQKKIESLLNGWTLNWFWWKHMNTKVPPTMIKYGMLICFSVFFWVFI